MKDPFSDSEIIFVRRMTIHGVENESVEEWRIVARKHELVIQKRYTCHFTGKMVYEPSFVAPFELLEVILEMGKSVRKYENPWSFYNTTRSWEETTPWGCSVDPAGGN